MKKKLNTRLRRCQLMISFLSLVTIISLAFASIFSFSNANAVTFESEQGVAFTFNPTVTISITGGTGATNDGLTITNLTPGDVKDSNIITVSASANTPLGYSLSSTVGSSTYNTTELRKDGTSTANKFANLTANKASLSNFDDNTWGYSYSTDSGSTWISGDITSTTATGYNGLPIYTTSSPIKLINSSTAGSSSIKFKIGAKASTSQIAGTYNNVINFIGTGKVVTTTYTINYNDPSGEADPTTMPAAQQGTESQGTGAVQISSTVPVRTDYMFKGWCTASTTDDTCSGDTVQPGGMLALNPGTSSATPSVTKTLYAMWKSNSAAPGLCTDAATCMQTMTTCPTTATTVTDARDGKQYRVQQLNGGKCWMLENLRLDLTDSGVQSNLTSDTTNASDTTLNYLINGGGTTSDKYPTAAVQLADSSNYYSIPAIAKAGSCYNAYCVDSPSSGQWDSEVITPATINGVTSIAQGKVGIYYNYCAVSAGSYCWGDGTASTGSPSSDPDTSTIQDIKEDICPYGWRLPTSSSTGEFQALYAAYNSNVTDFQTALSTPLSGTFYSGTARRQGSYGYFWSSTWISTSNMRALYVNSSNVTPSNSNNRNNGNSARCILGS